MNFIKAYKERIEEVPRYIDDYESYLLDEFAFKFVHKTINEYFNNGKKNKTIEIPISEIWDFFEKKGNYVEKDKYGKVKEPRKIEEVNKTLLDDIRNIFGFKVENGHLIINLENLISSYYDYLYACHEIPENLDDYAFYLFDEFVKEFVPILIKTYNQNMKDNPVISFPLIQVWRIFDLKGYKAVESAKPIILKDMRNFGFKIEGAYNGYIVIDLATLMQAYLEYILIDEANLTDLGYNINRKKDFIQDYFKELSKKAAARKNTEKRNATLNAEKKSTIPVTNSTLLEESMDEVEYLSFLKTYFGSSEESIPAVEEKNVASTEVSDINEIFKSEIVSKSLNEMINFCTNHNLDKIVIDYAVFDNYVIYNGLRINNVNASEFTNLIASIPSKMVARQGNTIKIEYNLVDLYDFYYEELNKVTR